MARGNSRAQSENQTRMRNAYNFTLPATTLPEGHTAAKPSAFLPASSINLTAMVNKPPFNDPQVSGKIYVTPYSAENFGSLATTLGLMTRAERKELEENVSKARKTNPGLGGINKAHEAGLSTSAAVAVDFEIFKKIAAAKIDTLDKIDKVVKEQNVSKDKAKQILGFGQYSNEEKLISTHVSPYRTVRAKEPKMSESASKAEARKHEQAVQRAYEADPRQFMVYRNNQWMIAD